MATLPKGLKGRTPDQIIASRAKFLIFSKAGAGKTWGATDFPNCYLIDTEGGATRPQYVAKMQKSGVFYMGKEDGSLNIEEVTRQVEILATQKGHDRKTLIIDSISKLFNHKCAEMEKTSGNKFSADRKAAMPFLRRLMFWINQLDMNVILTAHEKEKYENNESVGQTFDGPDKLDYDLDLVGRVIIQAGVRKLKIMKSRIHEFPDSDLIPWSYDEFANRYGRDLLEAESQIVVMATAEQIQEFEMLIKLLNIPSEKVAKRLTDYGAETPAELNCGAITAIVTALRTSVAKIQKGNE